ncbi:hypothetical protein D3C73_798080 [compost metagenome]
MEIIDIKDALKAAKPQLKKLYDLLQEAEDSITYESASADDLMHRSLFYQVKDKFESILPIVSGIDAPIIARGRITKKSNGRYKINESHYLTCGSMIEVLICDDFDDREKWVSTRVEHKNGDYYIVGYPNVPMQGLLARVRKYDSLFQ